MPPNDVQSHNLVHCLFSSGLVHPDELNQDSQLKYNLRTSTSDVSFKSPTKKRKLQTLRSDMTDNRSPLVLSVSSRESLTGLHAGLESNSVFIDRYRIVYSKLINLDWAYPPPGSSYSKSDTSAFDHPFLSDDEYIEQFFLPCNFLGNVH